MKQIVVIGAGAAGLMSAWHAKKENTKVTVLEAGKKAGRKLLATGNGRCNLTYASKQPLIAYRGNNPEFAAPALAAFSQEDTLHFFAKLGMLVHKKNDGIYPYTDQAQTVLATLLHAVQDKGVKIKTNERVTKILPQKKGFLVYTEGWKYETDAVILCCGSMAAPALGGCSDGTSLAAELGHTIVPLYPALVPLRTAEKRLYGLAGLRSSAEITLYTGGREISRQRGELQWTSYGISGIVVFQLSRFAAKALAEKIKTEAVINLLPDYNLESIKKFLLCQKKMRADRLLSGIFPEKLAAALLELCGFSFSQILGEQQITEVLQRAMKLTVRITGTRDFEQAQTCAGGVDTREVDSKTMESQKISGLFFAGELLDIDGACGGYNLQWAWSSGYVAGTNSGKA